MRDRTPLHTWRKAAKISQPAMAAHLCMCLRSYQYQEGDTTRLEGWVAEACARIIGAALGRTIRLYRDLYTTPYTPLGNDSAARPSERQIGASGCVTRARGAGATPPQLTPACQPTMSPRGRN